MNESMNHTALRRCEKPTPEPNNTPRTKAAVHYRRRLDLPSLIQFSGGFRHPGFRSPKCNLKCVRRRYCAAAASSETPPSSLSSLQCSSRCQRQFIFAPRNAGKEFRQIPILTVHIDQSARRHPSPCSTERAATSQGTVSRSSPPLASICYGRGRLSCPADVMACGGV
ncbi:hypothetical protein DPEC_G00103130 [Dallia pectoralis]|uniref:Uncharacterized protein n=1 Tax=Dallia pectoralis TaxID=75939 RepID=A0ACC2GXP9_DALPE|nr:hypothetical protein DPEC_G00103130 [Dallia pectoralis]